MSAMRSEPGQKSHHLSKDGMREKLLQRAHKFFCFVLFSFSILIEIIIQKQMQLISCFFDKSIRDLIIIWELTAQLIHSLVISVLAPTGLLPFWSWPWSGSPHWLCYFLCRFSSRSSSLGTITGMTLYPEPKSQSPFKNFPEYSLGKVIIFSTIKFMKCRLNTE